MESIGEIPILDKMLTLTKILVKTSQRKSSPCTETLELAFVYDKT